MKSFSPEPVGQFQPSFAQNILWWRVYMLIMGKYLQTSEIFFFKSIEPLGQFQTNLAKSIPGWRDLNLFKWKGHTFLHQEIIITKLHRTFTKFKNLLILNYWANFIICIIKTSLRYINWFELVSQVSDLALGPLVYIFTTVSVFLFTETWKNYIFRFFLSNYHICF